MISAVKPAPGSSTRDRTPLAAARVTDGETRLSGSRVRVYVDGRLVRGSYDAATGNARAQLPSLKPGRHVLKVTATDEVLTKTSSSRFSVR